MFIALNLLLFFLGGNPSAQVQEKKQLPFPITEYTLKNGLKVIISEENSLPLVSVVVVYNVGSVNEQEGEYGLAYMLGKLMLFQGSEHVSPMQHISLIDKVGGVLNATTTEDKTIFQQTVPSNQLVRVLWLESDRMKSLQITNSNVEQAKVDIREEIRNRKATEPYLLSFWFFDQLLYPDIAHSHPVIGEEADLRNITVDDVKEFYSTFYIPNNAVLSIAGNIDKEKAIEEVRKYFETIPKGKDTPPIPLPKDSEKTPIVVPITDSLAPSPGFHLGYEIAPPSSEDFYALKIIEYILLRGKTSRLYKRLVKKDGTALHISGGIEKRKNLARFKIFVVNNNEFMAERSKRAIFSEINKLRSSHISAEELTKVKNMFKMDYINQYATPLGKALLLAETFLSKKSLDSLATELDKYLAVTSYNIIRATNKYLTQGRIILDIKVR